MEALLKALEGKKSYIVSVLVALVAIAKSQEWIDAGTYQILMGLLVGGGIASLRNGIKK